MEPVTSPDYWRERLKKSLLHEQLHQSVYLCTDAQWNAALVKHRSILSKVIKSNHSILDAGCGYGRLVEILPADWNGCYVGIDISPDLIAVAKTIYPNYFFRVQNILEIGTHYNKHQFDFAIITSVKYMIIRNIGKDYWKKCEEQLRIVAKQLLFLEYDATDEGSVE